MSFTVKYTKSYFVFLPSHHYEHFILDYLSLPGVIRVATQLDRETEASYWLTVYAQDHGTVPMSSSVEVYISVVDVNDNPPETDQPVYYVDVPENSAANRIVKRIQVYHTYSLKYVYNVLY